MYTCSVIKVLVSVSLKASLGQKYYVVMSVMSDNTSTETSEPVAQTAQSTGPVTHQEDNGSGDDDSDSSTDFDPEEIEKEIMGVKSLLRRYCGRHKVKRGKTYIK